MMAGRDTGGGARRILVIWNPKAGEKAGLPTNRSSRDQLRELMRRHELGDELVDSGSAEEGARRAEAAVRAGYDTVVAAGGDGTAYTIARQLLGTQTALGLLPVGSAMNLARALDIPHDLDAAAGIIAKGSRAAIDVGLIGGQPFFEIVSIGLGAEVLASAQAIDRRRRWGAIAGFIRLAARYRRTRIELIVDEAVLRTRALALVVANGPHTGLGLTLAPDASMRDGELDVLVFEGLSPTGLVWHMLRAAGGRRPPSPWRPLRGRHVRVSTHRPLAIRADDHDAGFTPVELSVQAAALHVIVPTEGDERRVGRATA